MKKTLTMLLISIISNLYGQTESDFSFKVKDNIYNYKLIEKSNSESFDIIFINIKDNIDIEKIKKCTKNTTYLFTFDNINDLDTDIIFIEFLSDLLSKRKLIDKKMNIYSNIPFYEYLSYYLSKNRKYNGVYLNRINNFQLIEDGYFCD